VLPARSAQSEAATVGEVAAAYRGCRERITELLTGLHDRQARTDVPACPGWRVRDVVAHLSGGIADVLAGRLDGAGTDEWTAAQVRARRGCPLVEILHEWHTNAPRVEPLMDSAGEIGRQAVADVVTHEHDIRGALRRPGARGSDAVIVGLGFGAARLVEAAASRGVALRVQSTNRLTFGSEHADVTLTAEPFELLRAITGRRSVDQLRAMPWDGDCERAIPAFWWYGLHPADARIDE